MNTHHRKRAFTIIEASIATLIVGVTVVAALDMVGATKTGRVSTADRTLGQLLAQQLMSEVLHHFYEDPDGSPVFGIEADEVRSIRNDLDDIDDFDGWVESPPVYADGTALAPLSGWSREVHVNWIDATDHSVISLVESGVKKVTVQVFKGTMEVGQVVCLRTAAGDEIVNNP